MMKSYLPILGLLLSGMLYGQELIPAHFSELLDSINATVLTPVENSYRLTKRSKNNLQPYQLEWKAKKESIIIRYFIEPNQPNNLAFGMTHIHFSRILTNLVTNEESANTITVVKLSETEQADFYHADWGKLAYFTPKKQFSDKTNCQMLSLYKEDKGYIHIFVLFDKVSPAIEQLQYIAHFIE